MKNMEDNWEVFKELGINPVDIMRELAQIEEEAEKEERRWRREKVILLSILALYTVYMIWKVF